MGVGDGEATAVAATVTWMARDGASMLARIFFAWAFASLLDSHPRPWRLLADVFNDLAFLFEILSPLLSVDPVFVLCASSVFRGLFFLSQLLLDILIYLVLSILVLNISRLFFPFPFLPFPSLPFSLFLFSSKLSLGLLEEQLVLPWFSTKQEETTWLM